MTVKKAVLDILENDYVAIQSMNRGLMNLSKYARNIQKTVSINTKKEVGVQSIVVALSRLEKETRTQTGTDRSRRQTTMPGAGETKHLGKPPLPAIGISRTASR